MAFIPGVVVSAGAIILRRIGATIAAIEWVAARSSAESLATRLTPRVGKLLASNSAAIGEMVNLISEYVMPDFQDTLANAHSEQELDATLNYLRRTAVQTICCVFLESERPDEILCNPDAIQAAVKRQHKRVRQAEIVVAHLSKAMNGITMIDNDDTEERARAILTTEFIQQALYGT
jgi:hypothetical protein